MTCIRSILFLVLVPVLDSSTVKLLNTVHCTLYHEVET